MRPCDGGETIALASTPLTTRTDWHIRRATSADAAAVALVASAAFLQTYAGVLPGRDIVAHCLLNNSADRFARWAFDPDSVVTLAEHADGAAPVGYTVLTPPDFPIPTRPDDIELKRIYTLNMAHGTGLGPALMVRALADARALGRTRLLLGVHPGNARARRLYERHGLRVIGERVFQVGTGDLRMTDPVYAVDL